MADERKEIRRAVDTGKVVFGTKKSENNILKGNGKLIILSENTQKAVQERISHTANAIGIPLKKFGGTSLELGSVCGKPFPVSVMLVLNEGKSKILGTGAKQGKK